MSHVYDITSSYRILEVEIRGFAAMAAHPGTHPAELLERVGQLLELLVRDPHDQPQVIAGLLELDRFHRGLEVAAEDVAGVLRLLEALRDLRDRRLVLELRGRVDRQAV